MKIGIDAKWFFEGPISGKVIIRNLLPELIKLYPEHEWHIFLNKKTRHRSFPFLDKNIHLHYVWAGINMFSNLFVLPRLVKKYDVDIVLFQTFAPRSRSFQSVVFIHDILFEEYPHFFTWKEKLYFKFVKKSCRSAARVITTSETVKKDLLKYNYANSSKIDLAPLGVSNKFKSASEFSDDHLSLVKTKYQLPEKYILFTGRLNARKNIETILKALPSIHKDFNLVIAGEENWKPPEFSLFLKNQNIYSRLQFTGSIPENDLTAIYAMARLFCFPSFAEGFGLPPLEAMASGVPVIVSNTTSMPEVCGNAAVYVNPNDQTEIAKKVNELLNDPSLYEKKVQQGLERVKDYTWEKTAQSIMKSLMFANI